MKKLLGTVIAFALLVSPGLGSAEILKNLKVGGNLDLQTVSGRNITDMNTVRNDRIGTAMTRLMVDMSWDMLDDVHALVTLRKNDRAWGDDGKGGQGAGSNQTISGAAAANPDLLGNTYIQQAAVKIDKVFGGVDMSFGRQYFGEKGDLVMYFGPTDDFGLNVTAVDSFVANYSNDMVDITGMAGVADNNNNIGALGNNDVNIHGTELWLKGLPLKTGAYVWRKVTHNTQNNVATVAAPNDVLWVYGLKLRGDAAGAFFQADAAFNGGKYAKLNAAPAATTVGPNEGTYIGKAFLAKAGYKAEIPNLGGIMPWANFGWGSGESDTGTNTQDEFQSIRTDYRPGIINRRFNTGSCQDLTFWVPATNTMASASTSGLGNRVLWGAGINFTPAALEKFTIGGEIWDYRFQRTDASQFGAAGTWTAARGNKHIGTEWGFTATWKHSENVVLDAGYAGFQPGGYIQNIVYSSSNGGGNAHADPVRVAFADIGIKF